MRAPWAPRVRPLIKTEYHLGYELGVRHTLIASSIFFASFLAGFACWRWVL